MSKHGVGTARSSLPRGPRPREAAAAGVSEAAGGSWAPQGGQRMPGDGRGLAPALRRPGATSGSGGKRGGQMSARSLLTAVSLSVGRMVVAGRGGMKRSQMKSILSSPTPSTIAYNRVFGKAG